MSRAGEGRETEKKRKEKKSPVNYASTVIVCITSVAEE